MRPLSEHVEFSGRPHSRDRKRCILCGEVSSFYCPACSSVEKAAAMCCGVKDRDCYGKIHLPKGI